MARTRTGGWYDFAGALLGIAGALHGFAGLMGLVRPEYTTAAPAFLDTDHVGVGVARARCAPAGRRGMLLRR